MFSKLSSLWNFGNHYSAIEITTIDGKEQYYGVSAEKKKGEFVNLSFASKNSLANLSRDITSKHAFLVINTDKVLIKAIDLERDTQQALSKTFPGLSTTDFYYEILHQKEKSFVAVCRKEEVQYILNEAEKEKLTILGFRLGFGSISPLLNLLGENSVTLSKHTLEIVDGAIYSFSNNVAHKSEYSIEESQVSSNHLLSLAALFGYVTQQEFIANLNSENNRLKKAHLEKNFFKKGLVIGIAAMLLMLLINMFYFTNYRKQYQNLQEETQLAKVQKEVLAEKNTQIEKKERIVTNMLSSGNSKSSFYINRIVANSPNTIIFSELNYQPLSRSIRPDKPIEYIKNEMVLKGESTNKEAYSLWVEGLENLDWITKVTIIEYGSDTARQDYFEIKLMLNDDPAK